MKESKKSITLFLILVVAMAILTTPAVASSFEKQITVLTGINICVDDVKLVPRDANGQSVEVFIYNGTTYLPVRALAEALDQNVAWDGRTNTVFIGEHESNEIKANLMNLDVFYEEGDPDWRIIGKDFLGFDREPMDNLGNEYDEGLYLEGEGLRVYNVNQRYKKLNGVLAVSDYYQDCEYKNKLKVYGDGKLLYESPSMTKGVYPVAFEVDVTGVVQLKVETTGQIPELILSGMNFY